MLKFLTDNFSFIVYGFEIAAMLVGILCYKKFNGTTTQIFIYYLMYVAFVDCFGATFFYLKEFPITSFLISNDVKSVAWYNFFWFFGSIVFVLYYIYRVLKIKKNKRFLQLITVLFIIIILGHFIINPEVFFKQHHSLYQLLGAFSILISVSVYFIEFISGDEITKAFKSFSFYALSALFIWWIIVTPILLFDAYNTAADWDFANLKRRIFLFANIFMYSCFIIGLIMSKPELKE